MNANKKAVELRTSKHTTDTGALQKGEDFVKAFSLGFDVREPPSSSLSQATKANPVARWMMQSHYCAWTTSILRRLSTSSEPLFSLPQFSENIPYNDLISLQKM